MLAYDIRFDPGFDWSIGGELPGLSGVAPGVPPTYPAGGGNLRGIKGWSGRMMWGSPAARWMSYMYGASQVSKYGDGIAGRSTSCSVVAPGQQCYTMNSARRRQRQAAGLVRRPQVLNVTNRVYRTRSDVHISHLMWSIFRGGSSMDWAGSRNSYIDFDNVTITTS